MLRKRFVAALKIGVRRWIAGRTALFAGAIAFQALLALAPLLLLLLSIAGPLLGKEEARQDLSESVGRFAGRDAARFVASIVDQMAADGWDKGGTFLGVVLMFFFASSCFAQFRQALDAVWGVERPGLGLFARLLAFGEALLLLAGGLLLLASGTLRAGVDTFLERMGSAAVLAWMVWTRLGTVLVTVVVLMLAFRYIPYVRPRPARSAAFVGAVVSGVTLNLGSDLIGRFAAQSFVASLYGAAGSLIIILVWLNCGAYIVLLGAEVCRAWDESIRSERAAPQRAA